MDITTNAQRGRKAAFTDKKSIADCDVEPIIGQSRCFKATTAPPLSRRLTSDADAPLLTQRRQVSPDVLCGQ
ncbi:hypothetical protein T12_10737 [Trichinella patagoniensis]|uniref:Uncharacterized protein n=1 Tax=Trichinella patagoniensis TaxID=990121 RepID=A0A0V1AGC5_9BILA|nr:hypothetical protein T12_10737 [Trichinella patagoniensis]